MHADSSRRAYRGILPDAFLDNEVVAHRVALWHERFYKPDEQAVTITLLAELNGELVGLAHSIVDEDDEWGTLLDNLHVRHDAQRLGIGRRLMADTAAWLKESGNTSGLYLWVLEQNTQARLFYERLGGQLKGHGIDPDGGGAAPMLRFWWPQLDRLSP